jgi:alpha-1,2-mannosyltransferase
MTYAATAAWLRPRLWVGAVVGVVPWAVWLGSLAIGGWYKDAEGTLIGADHLAFYAAAHLIRDGQPERMYDYRDLNDSGYQRNLIGWEWNGFEAFRNPPFYALLYLPTAGVSFYASCLIWMALGVGLLALSIWLLRPQRPVRVFLWSLAFYPVFATTSFGQNTLISLAIFSGAYRLLETDRRFAAGFVAGLLWFKPQLLLGLFIWWAFAPRRYFRCWLGVGAMGAILAALCWGVVPEASRAFVKNLPTIVGYHGFGLWNVHTPKVFFWLLLRRWSEANASEDSQSFELVIAINQVLALAITGISVAIAWRIVKRSHASVAAMFPVAVYLSLWASPHTLIYEWALLIAAGVVLWKRYPNHRDAWLCLFLLAWAGLTISTTFAYVQIRFLDWPCVVQISIPILGVVGWLGARELATARSSEEQC